VVWQGERRYTKPFQSRLLWSVCVYMNERSTVQIKEDSSQFEINSKQMMTEFKGKE